MAYRLNNLSPSTRPVENLLRAALARDGRIMRAREIANAKAEAYGDDTARPYADARHVREFESISPYDPCSPYSVCVGRGGR